MAIYRGAGGASEATDAATISQVQTYAAQAATSAAAAATSATSAASNATGASSSASAAATSASNALSYRNSAASYVSDASGYADDAAQEADDAANSALASLNYSNAASGHATDANGYMNNAQTYMDRAETAATNAAASATSASSSASAASTSATSASSSASAASSSASTASTAATSASSSATAAATSASTASSAADAALAALDNFDDRYLGQKSADPTLDNDGNALVAGTLYFNTVDNAMKVYDGSQWLAAYASLSGALLAVNNLSDVSDAASARTNLGLGTAATTNSTAYATAAQGALADTAVQPAAIANMLESADIGVTVQGYDATLLNDADIGVTVQGYDANTVVDASYVHTDNNYTTTEKSKLAGIEAGAQVNPTNISSFTNDSGYLTSYTETDPIYTASTWYTTTNNSSNWDTAYGWGNHASAGYLTSSSTVDGGTY